nr:hypothetical protein Iba_chr09aCG14850 [Ipomoea batatas]GMD34472.1 hypothetical protein Iba_chr09cCG12390 [Ipomoea batatas]GMD34475.1 hypothetical protein Iba_chr09cCG12420 [Ipomoea batatas]GMD36168.1 hypothetical protein Iba_chr09dCG13850 [Ipomoea batatas]
MICEPSSTAMESQDSGAMEKNADNASTRVDRRRRSETERISLIRSISVLRKTNRFLANFSRPIFSLAAKEDVEEEKSKFTAGGKIAAAPAGSTTRLLPPLPLLIAAQVWTNPASPAASETPCQRQIATVVPPHRNSFT